MRHFFSRFEPPFRRVLLVESGSRGLYEDLIPGIYETYPQVDVDLVTCYAGAPEGLRESARIYRVSSYPNAGARKQLYRELRARNYDVVGIICSDEPIMTKWKWALAHKIPAKVFVVNENGDRFWLDRHHWQTIRHFAAYRAGLGGADAAGTIARLLLFPFTLAYLLTFAAVVHARRQVRLRFHL